jgi:hypothetical protein
VKFLVRTVLTVLRVTRDAHVSTSRVVALIVLVLPAVAHARTITNVATLGHSDIVNDAASNLFVTSGAGTTKIEPDGRQTTIFGAGQVLATDGAGNLFVAQSPAVFTITPDGTVTQVIDGTAATPCTTGSTCAAGTCAVRRFTCPLCEPCDPTLDACVAASQTGCRQPTAALKARLELKAGTSESLPWKWVPGGETLAAHLGDPLTTTDYALCLYDGGGNALLKAAAPADGLCAGKPAENGQCWEATYDIAGALRNDPTGFDGRTH